jgi:hypothetical protein
MNTTDGMTWSCRSRLTTFIEKDFAGSLSSEADIKVYLSKLESAIRAAL